MIQQKVKVAFIGLALSFIGTVAQSQNAQSKREGTVYMVADAHLDTQWNWDVQSTIKDNVWNTLSQNLFLLKKYPNYVFNFEGGVKYAWMKEYYPAEYAEMKKYIQSGRWHISGSSWDANDVLVPSPESTIRNILLGQEYYRKEFNIESTDIFLPDCFGFGWTLPTVASHCGLIGFSSQKLGWRSRPFYGKNKYPFTIGLWKGIDGASIMFAHGYDYGHKWNDVDLSEDKGLYDLAVQNPLKTVYRYYGVGDRGGSPTMASVRSVEKGVNGDGPLKIISATSDQLFKDYLPYANHSELPVFDGELLMDVHGTGCYTSQAAMKFYNRQNELLGDAAERAAVSVNWLNRTAYPSSDFTEIWKRVIYHQFHDDLTGTSIPRAYEFSWNDELISLQQFSDLLTSSVSSVVNDMDTRTKGRPVVLYNPLGFEVNDEVEIELSMPKAPEEIKVFDSQGNRVRAQMLNYKDGKVQLAFDARVPAVGYAVYDVRPSGTSQFSSGHLANSVNMIENSIYKVTVDSKGDIISLIDKRNDKELVKKGKTIRLALFAENESPNWPAWEILKKTVDKEPISIGNDQTEIALTENGVLRKTLCIKKKYGESSFVQYIRLYEGALADRIDFCNEIEWRTANALLKAEFPLNIENKEATYDLGIGSVKRGNNTQTAYEVYAQYWADLTDKDDSYGVTVMNDCKYGWDKPDDHTLRLTLIHTPGSKVKYLHQNSQDFGYHCFTYSLMGHLGQLNKAQTVQKAEQLNQRLKAFQAGKHKGLLGKEFSFVASNNNQVLIKALKRAESSDEYVIRVYETGGEQLQQASIIFASDVIEACEADGTEKKIDDARFKGNQLLVTIKPNSIKTFKVKLKPSLCVDNKLNYAYQPLKYNRKCVSWNGFRREGNMEKGYSYAAELLPDSMIVNQIPFRLGEKDILNGLACEGDTLILPKGNNYNKIYFLAASTDKDYVGTFTCGTNNKEIDIPCYTGFIGQWGHVGHTEGYLKQAEIAYVGTHRHGANGDLPYEFTYMFKFGIDIPKGATSIILPRNEKIMLFAATLVEEKQEPIKAVSQLFHSAIKK